LRLFRGKGRRGKCNHETQSKDRNGTFHRLYSDWRTVEHYGGAFVAGCYKCREGVFRGFPARGDFARFVPNLVLAQAFIALTLRNKWDLGVSSSNHVAPTCCRNGVVWSVSFLRDGVAVFLRGQVGGGFELAEKPVV